MRPFFAAPKKGRRPPGESGIRFQPRAAARKFSPVVQEATAATDFAALKNLGLFSLFHIYFLKSLVEPVFAELMYYDSAFQPLQ